MKCPFCNGDNVSDAVFCANCGVAIAETSEPVPQPTVPEGQMPPVYQTPSYGYVPPVPDPNDKKALVGMILGIASMPCCCISTFTPVSIGFVALGICALMGIVGIFMSAAGLKSKNKRGMAIAGLVCSIVGVVLIAACIALLAFGNYALESGLYDDILNQYYNMIIR